MFWWYQAKLLHFNFSRRAATQTDTEQLYILIRVADPDPHYFWKKLDPDPN